MQSIHQLHQFYYSTWYHEFRVSDPRQPSAALTPAPTLHPVNPGGDPPASASAAVEPPGTNLADSVCARRAPRRPPPSPAGTCLGQRKVGNPKLVIPYRIIRLV